MNETLSAKPYLAAPGQNPFGREIQTVLDALRGRGPLLGPLGTWFGSVEIIVQDSRIVQIERLEKRRLV